MTTSPSRYLTKASLQLLFECWQIGVHTCSMVARHAKFECFPWIHLDTAHALLERSYATVIQLLVMKIFWYFCLGLSAWFHFLEWSAESQVNASLRSCAALITISVEFFSLSELCFGNLDQTFSIAFWTDIEELDRNAKKTLEGKRKRWTGENFNLRCHSSEISTQRGSLPSTTFHYFQVVRKSPQKLPIRSLPSQNCLPGKESSYDKRPRSNVCPCRNPKTRKVRFLASWWQHRPVHSMLIPSRYLIDNRSLRHLMKPRFSVSGQTRIQRTFLEKHLVITAMFLVSNVICVSSPVWLSCISEANLSQIAMILNGVKDERWKEIKD